MFFFLCFGYDDDDDDDDDDDAFGDDDARFSARCCALKSLSSFLCSTALTC